MGRDAMDTILQRAKRKPMLSVLAVLLLAIFLFASLGGAPATARGQELGRASRRDADDRDAGRRFRARAGDRLDAMRRTADGEGHGELRRRTMPTSDNVWFMVEPQPGGCLCRAHAACCSNSRAIARSASPWKRGARRTRSYDAFQGLFNKFELAYIWSTSKELLTRRAVFLKKDVYVYPLHAQRASRRTIS